MHSAELVVKSFVEKPEESDEPICGPGPFSMADADTTSAIVVAAGFEDVALRRRDIPISLGATVDDAVAFVTALGPAGEVLRLLGDRADDLRPTILAALRENLAQFETPDGIVAPASTWIVTARAPAPADGASHVRPRTRGERRTLPAAWRMAVHPVSAQPRHPDGAHGSLSRAGEVDGPAAAGIVHADVRSIPAPLPPGAAADWPAPALALASDARRIPVVDAGRRFLGVLAVASYRQRFGRRPRVADGGG